MKKLVVLNNAPMVEVLMQRLEEASIKAFCVPERSGAERYIGGPPSMSIWIAEAEDLGRAAQLLQEVEAEGTQDRCPGCGYDLRGHAGQASCPECGRPFTAPAPDRACPRCHEAVPPSFEICWNCGADVPEAGD